MHTIKPTETLKLYHRANHANYNKLAYLGYNNKKHNQVG